jgi:hypothetical protein
MAIAQLFFGLSIKGRGPVTDAEWTSFARDVLTRYFPDGFTAYDADGQWLNSRAHQIVRERSKVVVIAAEPNPAFAKNIEAVSAAYRAQFHQQSVGVLTQTACAAF